MKKEEKKVQEKKSSGKTKNRKGGEKVRKAAPAKRLQATLAKFQRQVAAARVERGRKEALQITKVRDEGMGAVMNGGELFLYLRNVNVPVMSSKKIERVLG